VGGNAVDDGDDLRDLADHALKLVAALLQIVAEAVALLQPITNLAFEPNLVRDVAGEFDDLPGTAIGIEHGIIGGLDPYVAAITGPAPIAACLIFAASQPMPELAIVLGADEVARAEQAMMLPDEVTLVISEDVQEILVGADDDAIELELDHGLRSQDRLHSAFEIGVAFLRGGDVGCDLQDALEPAIVADNRIICRLQP